MLMIVRPVLASVFMVAGMVIVDMFVLMSMAMLMSMGMGMGYAIAVRVLVSMSVRVFMGVLMFPFHIVTSQVTMLIQKRALRNGFGLRQAVLDLAKQWMPSGVGGAEANGGGRRLTRMLSCRVVRYRGGPVSCWVMPLQVRFSSFFAVVLALGVCAGVHGQAQNAGSQNPPAQPQGANSQSSSQSQPTQAPAAQGPDAQNQNYGVYIPVDPLALVRYDNRYDVSLGFAYDHMKAGPSLLEGANLGGLDGDASFWLTRHWGLQGSGRAYVGTSGTHVNSANGNGGDLQGPMVKQYFFVGGVEALGPHNKHGDILAHVMFGGVYGDFQKDLLGEAPGIFHFYYNQIAPAGIAGGSIDLNRSEHWVFRINCDAVMTHYNFQPPPNPPGFSPFSQYDVNYAMSVGLEYKFTKAKRSTAKANWVSGW